MQMMQANGIAVHWRDEGAGAPVVFLNSLGTDLRLWDAVLPLLPQGLRVVRMDKRGHGLSEAPGAPYDMDTLISDAEAVLDQACVNGAVVVGLSIGGIIALGLAARRPDLVKAVVLSCSAARMGTPEMWADRIAAIETAGIESMADAVLDRWFGSSFRQVPQVALWRAMLTRTPQAGYLGCCHALAGADLTDAARGLRVPMLAIAGSEDGAAAPDLVAATAALVPGSRFEVIEGAGHLPCVEMPEVHAALLTGFLKEIDHV